MKRYVWGYIKNDLKLQISVYVHSIDRLIDVEQLEIKLSYKGGRVVLGKAIFLQGGLSLLPIVVGKYGVEASFQ